MRGRRIPKAKPAIVIMEDDPEMRSFYSKNLRDHCEIFFLTTRTEVVDFKKNTDFRNTNIRCIIVDGYFSEDNFKLSGVVYTIRNREFTGSIIAASDEFNDELMENGATDRPEGDLKKNVPALVLHSLGLD